MLFNIKNKFQTSTLQRTQCRIGRKKPLTLEILRCWVSAGGDVEGMELSVVSATLMLPSNSRNGFDIGVRDKKGFGLSAAAPWNGLVGGRDLLSVGDSLEEEKGLMNGLLGFSGGDLGEVGDSEGDEEGVTRLRGGGTCLSSELTFLDSEDGRMTRSSFPRSDQEKCVTVTGVVQRF